MQKDQENDKLLAKATQSPQHETTKCRNCEVSIYQDNAQHMERHEATMEKKTTSKVYAEAPLKQADSRVREADQYIK